MTLTEEQREAIRVISKLPMAIGCQLCHPYIMENYGSHFIVLRDMIDSSEHFTDHTKMIGFDLEKARAEVSTASARRFSESREQARIFCAEEILPDALDEIERLRASLIDLHAEYINTLEKNPECSAWDLDEQSDADQKRLRRNAAHAISIVEPPIYLQAEQRATKIKALEDALVEERVIGEGGFRAGQCEFWYIEDLPEESCMELDGPCDWAKCPRKHELCDVAYQQLAEEGKIGPDADAAHHECQECSEEFCDEDECPHDHTAEMVELNADHQYQPEAPRSWQITEERKAALAAMSNLSETISCPDCGVWIGFADIGPHMAVLRAMLREAE